MTKLANHQFRLEVFLSRDEQSRFGNDPALSNCHASNVSIDAMEYSYATEDNDTLQKLILFALRIDQNNNELRHEYIDLENSIYSSPKTPLVFLFRSLTATHQFPDLEIHYKQQPENLKKSMRSKN
ncbi:MAG: hypothetical protein HWD59_10970 [Coxiellaceae bacterium]|nr:MAG: hypothetical protein HWD59_10970 [Coxiellaceae bacterium]